MRVLAALGFVALAGAAAPALALSAQSALDLANSVAAHGQYSGVVGVRVQTNGGHAGSCTGTVIGGRSILTAAHCLNIDGTGVAHLQIVLPDLTTPLGKTINVSAFYTPSIYSGVAQGGADIAVLQLDTNVPVGTTIYALDHGTLASNLGVEMMVGLGNTGLGATGTNVTTNDGQKRIGYNQYETTFDQILAAVGFGTPGPTDGFGALKGSELAYDFDSGLAKNDVFGALGLPGLGYVSADGLYHDTMATQGDSGAPHFENGKIVGVTSFGISSAFLYGSATACGAGFLDPSHSATSCTNSSFGEIGVDTRVSTYYDFIKSHITTQVPEPATWAMMIVGFGLVGVMQRRRLSGTAAA
jgi:secreted trypsin-like serine protease